MTSTTKSPKAAKRYTKSEGFRKDHKINWWLTAVVAVFSLTILIPLYFTIVTALKTPAEAGTFSLPTTWEWHNFADAWNYINYPKAALNSAIITVVAVCLTLLTNTFVAYAVARNMDKRFFRFLYYFFLAMMFVPFTVIMLPIAHQMGSLHLDNQLGLMLLYTILGLGTNLFIAIGFIRSIPVSLEEAARVDGAGELRTFFSVVFPMIKPGIGALAIFGSYIGKEHTLPGEALRVGILDTCVAFTAGLIIFPACSAFDVAADSGANLIFITLPNVFNSMSGGRLWGALFFVFMSFAALSTVIAVFENIICFYMDKWGWSRKKAVLVNTVAILVLSMPCVLGLNLWSGFQPLGAGTSIMDLEDFLVSDNILPLGSLVYLLFCVTRKGWGWDNFLAEANTGSGLRFPRNVRFYVTYLLPIIMFIIFVMGYWNRFFA